MRSENRLRSVIDNIPDIIMIYDNQGKILDFHMKDQSNLFEVSDSLIGKNLADVTQNGQRIQVLGAFELARKTGVIQSVELKLKIGSGIKYFEVRYFPLDNRQIMLTRNGACETLTTWQDPCALMWRTAGTM